MRNVLLSAATICLAAIPFWSQQVPATKPSVPELLAKLHSKDWAERSDAVDQIRADPAALRSRELKATLVDLLEVENQEVDRSCEVKKTGHQAVKAVKREDDGGEEFGEGYAEYIAWLTETVDSVGDWNDPGQACIMVSAGYVDYGSSPTQAADRARIAVPWILKVSKNDVAVNRAIAGPMLLEALANAKGTLASEIAKNAKQTILNNLHDPDDGVRAFTVDALGKFGETDMIPALKEVAANDPSSEVEGHSIRKSAIEAIAEIQTREGHK